MRIVDIREKSVDLSRYADASIPSGGLTTSIVAVVTDVVRHGKPVTGYGFASVGRFAQGGLIRERFAPRVMHAGDTNPLDAWTAMMAGEKPGGHGERCVAVGTLDMALWDAAAKIADLPLHAHLAREFGDAHAVADLPAYASGGYLYPQDDASRLPREMQAFADTGYRRTKIKIGATTLDRDLARIDIAARVFGADAVAVDAMNAYDTDKALTAARALAGHGLLWFEDVCDPLDFETQSKVAALYEGPIAAGEALFSSAEAKLLDRHGGLRRDRDILLFDPVHCYGLPGYIAIVIAMTERGWPRAAFWPHGGHLFSLHVASALGLGGVEVNPTSFPPFGGLSDGARPDSDGRVAPPDAPGIGFETRADLMRLFATLG
ncbi:MAG: mandelate racemase [Proteobacteria bacterium]|nr:mandelate racemase [Pseudomonadota bacterium]